MADETPVSPSPDAASAPEAQEPQAAVTPPEPPFNAQEAFARLERNLLTLASQMQTVQQQVPAPKGDEATNDELWSLAQQGNRQAFELYQERIADRRFQKKFGEVQSHQSVQNQLGALVQKYPEFADPNHPLTHRARAFKNVLVQMGAPSNIQTDLDAMLRAVADSREIIAPRAPVAASRTPAPGHLAPSHATTPGGAPRQEVVPPEEQRLARQMGVKDPAKAKERFWARQQNGQSSVSPTVIAALDVAERQGNVR